MGKPPPRCEPFLALCRQQAVLCGRFSTSGIKACPFDSPSPLKESVLNLDRGSGRQYFNVHLITSCHFTDGEVEGRGLGMNTKPPRSQYRVPSGCPELDVSITI